MTEIPDLPTDIETSSICSDSSSSTKGSETNASSIVLVQKKKTTSEVWRYFGFVPDKTSGYPTSPTSTHPDVRFVPKILQQSGETLVTCLIT